MGAARAHLLIQGRVQGVSFRYYTMQEAQSLGLTGWVRNLWDGRVEVLLDGSEDAVKQMIEWCQQGPPSAVVEDVEIAWEEPTDEFRNFRVRINAGGGPS
ncbi:MAG: acylphosphatase [Anaerolineales bacterium]|nr:acylphosphatase [Anaerolineales bacterium]TET97056.1 MAG: acylphosphatase [Anaerolineales bacterium]